MIQLDPTRGDTVVYSDLNFQLAPHLVKDAFAVYSALRNLLYTQQFERLFRPNIYADIDKYLFEPMDDETAFGLFSIINDSVRRNEPRVILYIGDSSVVPVYAEHRYKVQLKFTIKGLEDKLFSFIAWLDHKGYVQ